MCGIVGALTFDTFEKKSEEKQRTEASIFITTQLLQSTVERGKDATGVSLLWADGNYTGLKMGIPSPSFIARFGEEETEFKGMLKLWREYPKLCKVFMGHCRKASKGNSYDNNNNHPLLVGDMLYVHNGTLTNDDTVFEKMKIKRSAEVDSEAIGHLLHHFTKNGAEPFTKEVMDETTRRLNGTYSVIAASGNNPFQVAQFRDQRPAELCLVKPLKMVFIASEKKFLENVLFEYNKMTQLFLASDMPYIKKDDVQFKTMIDDSYLIWDLTLPITEETTIEDLYDWGKTPLRVDKIWKGTTTTTTYSSSTNYNAYNTSKKTVAASSVGAGAGSTENLTTKTTTKITGECSGLVWSNSLNKYKTQAGIDKSKKYGAVEIDIDKGELTIIGSVLDGDDMDLTETEKNKIESLLVGAAAIEEVANARVESALDNAKKNGRKPDSDGGDKTVVEIDMTAADPEALKIADQVVENGLPRYENNNEVVEDLELMDGSVLRAMPPFALANRLMKFIFKKAFIAGYMKAKKADPSENKTKIVPIMQAIDHRKTKKLEAAEKKIRVMKTVVKILSQSLESSVDVADINDAILDGIADTIRPDALKSFDMTGAFTVGDLKEIGALEKVRKLIEEESSKTK